MAGSSPKIKGEVAENQRSEAKVETVTYCSCHRRMGWRAGGRRRVRRHRGRGFCAVGVRCGLANGARGLPSLTCGGLSV